MLWAANRGDHDRAVLGESPMRAPKHSNEQY
jgi:hypothetical protein